MKQQPWPPKPASRMGLPCPMSLTAAPTLNMLSAWIAMAILGPLKTHLPSRLGMEYP